MARWKRALPTCRRLVGYDAALTVRHVDLPLRGRLAGRPGPPDGTGRSTLTASSRVRTDAKQSTSVMQLSRRAIAA